MLTMPAAAPALELTGEEREALERLARSTSARHRTVQQAKALLLAAEGVANNEIGRRVGVSANTVRVAGPLRREAPVRLRQDRARQGTEIVGP